MADTERKTKNSKARIEANHRYNQKAYDQLTIIVKKGQKAHIKEVAESKGESLNQYVNTAIDRRIESGE